ncbi:major prion protein 1-like [Cydia fagiglandana]|uniref:major prion protein 1-like n=1 Tax=Cydia fagiglandana TaxID=1458189 RepID=UPI002FEE5969
MNKVLCFGLVLCATLALTSAYPAEQAPVAPKIPALGQEAAPAVDAAEELQPEESRWGHGGGGWGHGRGHGGGWGYGGGYGRGHGGWGHGGHGGYGGWGHGGWGR